MLQLVLIVAQVAMASTHAVVPLPARGGAPYPLLLTAGDGGVWRRIRSL